MFRTENFFLSSFGIYIFIRIVEKTKVIFRFQDSSCCFCNSFFRNFSFRYRFFQGFKKTFANHIHINACIHCQSRNLLQISHPVINHFINSSIICYHKTFKFPLVSKNICHQPFVSCCWNTIHFIERSHHGTHSSVNSCFVRWKIIIEH